MTVKAERTQKLLGWVKAALLTATVMGTLWLLLFASGFVFRSETSLFWAIYFLLVFPGMLILLPFIASNLHNADLGFMALSSALNWLIYSQFVYMLIRWRRSKRKFSGGGTVPPPIASSKRDGPGGDG